MEGLLRASVERTRLNLGDCGGLLVSTLAVVELAKDNSAGIPLLMELLNDAVRWKEAYTDVAGKEGSWCWLRAIELKISSFRAASMASCDSAMSHKDCKGVSPTDNIGECSKHA